MMNRFVRIVCALVVALQLIGAVACAKTENLKEDGLPVRNTGHYAIIDTDRGIVVIELYNTVAPKTVENFETLTKKGFYNGLTFHRVIKGFMIQTGDVNATGSSPCGIPDIKDEIDPVLNFKSPGVLAMANKGSRNSAACQIFITVANADYLTGMYTIFGQVVSGQDVADAISKVPAGANDKPVTPVLVKTVTIERKP